MIMASCSIGDLNQADSRDSVVPQQPKTSDLIFVVNGGESSLMILNDKGKPHFETLKLPEKSFPHHLSFSLDQKTLAISLPGRDFSASHDSPNGHGEMPSDMLSGQFTLVDTATGKIKITKKTQLLHHNVAFSPDGREIWAASMEVKGRVMIYEADTLDLIQEILVGNMPAEVSFSADGKRAFVANGGSDSVTAIDVSTKKIIDTIEVGDNPVGAWPGKDNRLYVDNERAKTISVLNASNLQIEQTLNLGFTPGMASLSPENELWVTDTNKGGVAIYTRNKISGTFEKNREISTGAGAHAIAFDTKGHAFVSNQAAHTVSFIDIQTGKKLSDYQVGNKPNGLAVLPSMD